MNIEQQAAEVIRQAYNKGLVDGFAEGYDSCLKERPGAKKYAKWRKKEWLYGDGWRYECSACGALNVMSKYCPNCGRKMRGEE